MRIDICGTVGKLVQIGFAQQDAAGIQETIHDCGVFFRHEILQDSGACGGAYSSSMEKILQADRNAVQRSPVVPLGDFLFCLAGLRKREISSDGQVGIDDGLQPGNPIQDKPGHFYR